MNLLLRLERDEEERRRLERQVAQLKAKISLLNKVIESYQEELNGKV